MTEEEAKTKWCPHARIPSGEPAVAVNRPEPYDNDVPHCLGSFCMAWRWLHKAGTDENDQPNYYAGPWQGYCGLAGRP